MAQSCISAFRNLTVSCCCLVFASSRTSVCFAIAAANFCPHIFGLGHSVPRRPTQKRFDRFSPLRARTLPRDSALREIRFLDFPHGSILYLRFQKPFGFLLLSCFCFLSDKCLLRYRCRKLLSSHIRAGALCATAPYAKTLRPIFASSGSHASA